MNLRPPGYEPGELPGCSTPRREGKDSIRHMPWWTWVALGIFVASLIAASVIGLLMLRSLKALQVTSERLAAALEDRRRVDPRELRRMSSSLRSVLEG